MPGMQLFANQCPRFGNKTGWSQPTGVRSSIQVSACKMYALYVVTHLHKYTQVATSKHCPVVTGVRKIFSDHTLNYLSVCICRTRRLHAMPLDLETSCKVFCTAAMSTGPGQCGMAQRDLDSCGSRCGPIQ